VTTPDGRAVARKVEKNIENLKVGDQIDITYTRALLTSVGRQSEESGATIGRPPKSGELNRVLS
jgi:hypothetical protein